MKKAIHSTRAQCLGLFVVTIAVMLCFPPSAKADSTATLNYYTISSNDPDANNLSFGTVNNEVQQLLGPNGLPILNTPAYGCVSNCFSLPSGPTNLTAGGEITYWSPALNPYVTYTGSTTITLPFDQPYNFYPPNGTGSGNGGTNGFQAATISATLNAGSTEQISFNIGADDMAFAFLDGQVVCDLGGVHADTAGTCTSSVISAGPHSLEVFFVDINEYQSGLTFGVNTQDVTLTPPPAATPEPATLTMLGAGLVGVAVRKRRARK